MEKKVAFYVRCSTHTQDHEYQKDILEKNLQRCTKLVHIYEEKESGFKSEKERPEMNALLNAVEQGKYDEIWATEYTRISRNQIDLLKIIKFLEGAPNTRGGKGVNLYIVKEGLNTLMDFDGDNPSRIVNPQAKMIISFFSCYGEMEVNTTRFRMLSGKKDSVKNSNYVGGTLPYGYKYHDNGNKNKPIYVDDKEKAIVLRIYRDYCIKGLSLYRLAKALNLEGIPTKNQIENRAKNHKPAWASTTLKKILTCNFYIGERIYSKEKIKLNDDLIFKELFEEIEGIPMYEYARRKLKNNKYIPKPHKESQLLMGVLKCSCGSKMYSFINSSKEGKISYLYSCYKNHMGHITGNKSCHSDLKSINIEKIDSLIWTFLKNKIDDFKIEMEKQVDIQESIDIQINLLNEKIENIKKEKIEINNRKERVEKAYIENIMEFESYKIRIKDLNDKLEEADRLIEEYKREIYKEEQKMNNWDIADEVKMNINRIESDKQLMKSYIDKMIKSITIYAAGNKANEVVIKLLANGIIADSPTWIVYNTRSMKELKFYYYNWFGRPLEWDNDKKFFNVKTELPKEDGEHKKIEWKTESIDPYLISDEYFAATSGLPLEYVKGMNKVSDQEFLKTKYTYSIEEFKHDCQQGDIFCGVMEFNIYPSLRKNKKKEENI